MDTRQLEESINNFARALDENTAAIRDLVRVNAHLIESLNRTVPLKLVIIILLLMFGGQITIGCIHKALGWSF